ncbi:MAG: periplasmic heavy metal sensor [Pseudomonadales bacterium]|nr:periplasmic heavy metal sensor [Pseudomonadales bacterium]NIX09645.1 periplasmic heavy metal sensor [Pseudomonadales bacterium]
MPRNKWLILALGLSLGANLVMAGFLAGRVTSDQWGPRLLDPNLRGTRVLLDQVPEARREVLRPLVRDQLRSIRPSIGGIRQAQREIEAALTAEPFDAAALKTALAAFRTHLDRSQETSHAAFVRLAGSLSSEERQLLGDGLASHGRHRPRGGPPMTMPPHRP